jgi:hypothetical protein
VERAHDTLPVPGRPEPPTVQDISPQLDFLYRAETSFTQSLQFADAKAGGVILILSIGFIDLFRNAKNFVDAHQLGTWGWVSTPAFCIAAVLGLLTVGQVGRALFPRRRASSSLFFFGVAASFPSAAEYGDRIRYSREDELIDTMAMQAWNVAKIASEKYRHLRLAYTFALLFVLGWGLARVAYSLAS